jgi:hypothetical protein
LIYEFFVYLLFFSINNSTNDFSIEATTARASSAAQHRTAATSAAAAVVQLMPANVPELSNIPKKRSVAWSEKVGCFNHFFIFVVACV